MKMERMFYTLLRLLAKEQIVAKEIADYFEVSVRTIYRDIDSLSLAGVPIISVRGTLGGFKILDNYKVDRFLLDEKELTSIIMGLNGLHSIIGDAEILEIIKKLDALTIKDKLSMYKINFNPWNQTSDNCITNLQQAIENKNIIEFNYVDSKSKESSRKVEPLELYYKNRAWYLYCFDVDCNDFRFFRTTRILHIEITDEKFIRNSTSTAMEKNLEWINLIDSTSKTVEVVFRFSPTIYHLVLDSFSPENIMIADNGDVIASGNYRDEPWLYSFILSFGPHVEILQPAYIRDKILEDSTAITKIYSTWQYVVMFRMLK